MPPPANPEYVGLKPRRAYDTRRLVLELAEQISGASAAVHVGASALNASIAKQSVYPQNLFFRNSSGLKRIIGRDLIISDFVAVFELVKNSFDAHAKNVHIVIEPNSIWIIDDGAGAFAGNKGVGRFSCDRLGAELSHVL